jgi:hypothetical protein
MSMPGSISAANDGRNAQCQPTSHTRASPTMTSSTSLNGEAKPSPNSGRNTTCTTSAASARPRAVHTRDIGERTGRGGSRSIGGSSTGSTGAGLGSCSGISGRFSFPNASRSRRIGGHFFRATFVLVPSSRSIVNPGAGEPASKTMRASGMSM